MATATINISIPEAMKAEVEQVIATEGYGNTSEFFRDLVRNYLKQRQEQKLEGLLLEAFETGDFTSLAKTDFEEIKQRGIQRLKNRVKKS
jgi:antitoxin ParD1/3/4